MASIRVHELAKDMDIPSKDLLEKLQSLGLNMKNHMSTIPSAEVNRIKNMVLNIGKPPQPAPLPNKPVRETQQIKSPQSSPRPNYASPMNQREGMQKDQGVRRDGPQFADQKKGMTTINQGQSNDNRGYQQRPRDFTSPQANKPQAPQDNKIQGPGGSRPQTPQGPQGNKPTQGPGGNRPQAPQGNKPFQGPGGNKPQGPQGNKPFQSPGGNKPQGPQGNKPFQSPGGNKPQRPQGNKPFQGPGGNRPQGPQGTTQPNGALNQGPQDDDLNNLYNKAEKAVGERAAYERGGITKTPTKKPTKYDDKRSDQKKGRYFKDKGRSHQQREMPVISVKHVTLEGPMTVQDFAHIINRKAADVIKKLIVLGVLATINQELDVDTLILLGGEFGITVDVKVNKEDMLLAAEEPDKPEDMTGRPPVVTIMGHVDHGKTSLLDVIRHTNVTSTEAGGITQHIGAYQVEVKGKKITFLDTPGHEAFTAMRARGAQVTDLAILVVAADDGVMPQTVEAINHAKAAKVPIIVAVNKIDKPEANPEKIKQELTEHGLVAEEWGGDTICVNVSAKTKAGLENLLEMILLVAEMIDLQANPNKKAKGTVIEAQLDKGRGPVATVLVQSGTLEIGDFVIVGTTQGRVRAMQDDKGRRIKKAFPSSPAEIVGLSDVPQAGDILQAVEDEKLAKQITSERTIIKREESIHQRSRISLDDLFIQIKQGEVQDLNIIIKADVQGSIEALKQSLEKLSNEEVRVNIIQQGVGAITETDVMLASASNAIIIGFNVRPDTNTRKAAESQQIDIRLYRVIYNAIEDVKAALSGLLKPEIREIVLGRAEVRTTFKVPKIGAIAGCYVVEGKILRNAQVRLVRDGIVVHEGTISSLKRFKDDVKDVSSGYECGIGLERFNDIHEGDSIEAFTFEEIKRELT